MVLLKEAAFGYKRYVQVLLASICCLSCSVDLDERLVPCPDNTLVESVHSWASTTVLRPSAGHDWQDLVREPFREYGRPPITMQELQRRWGEPVRQWKEEDRPFAEFELPDGILRFGLEKERSDPDAYTIWRLRWRSSPRRLSQILEEPAVSCVKEFLQPGVEIRIKGRESDIPSIAIRFDGEGVRDMRWSNFDQDQPDSSVIDPE